VQEAFNDMTMNLERLHNTLLSHNRELEAVNELAEAVTLGQGVDAVIGTALNRVIALMDVDVGSIYLLEKDGVTLKLKASQGLLSPDLTLLIANTGKTNSPMQCLLETGHAVAIEDIRTSPELSTDLVSMLCQEGYTSWAYAPLKMEGEVIGLYHLGKRDKRVFGPHDLALLEIIGNIVGSGLSNANLLVDLRHKEAELRRALRRAVELQEEERKRLARELHDEIGQALTSILIHLKTLQEEEDVEAVNDRLNDLRSLAARTIEELHRLAMDLRPAALDSLGIVPALRWYIQQCAERTGLDIQFLGPEKYERLSPEIELTLYRVAQEGLTNAIRHGRAQKIIVFLERDLHLNIVRLTITDNGTGFNAATLDRGMGLVGIRERVELLCGNFNIETNPGAGTQLWIEIPLKR
jgi:signal transduction histidine kinase